MYNLGIRIIGFKDKYLTAKVDMFNEVCHFLNSGMASYTIPEHNRELL
jgi:hypothetical protein